MNHPFSVFRRYFRRSSESGQSVILLALGFVALAGFVGITTDISLMFVRYAQISRAVDSAAIAAANQMRQDRSNATVQLAARQFIEFYGVSPESVIVDTCLTTNYQDPDLCTDEQAKLVRVRAYVRQPTVFLRLLGVEHFDMWVAATSQTAALDVVIVMDVSESMAAQTTYADWAKTEKLGAEPGTGLISTTNYGVVYRVPNITEDVIRQLYPAATGEQASQYVTDLYQTGTGGIPGLLTTEQIKVNNLLTYCNAGICRDSEGDQTNSTANPPPGIIGEGTAGVYGGSPAFRVDYVNNFFNDTRFPGEGFGAGPSVQPPDAACRVRFYPRASNVGYGRFRGMKLDDGTFKSYLQILQEAGIQPSVPFFDGFVPTYNYFGCCNDPDGVGGFDDLVCQPFKQVRAATFDFLDRIDFLRGDRAAFVTYNRSAFLVNPFPYLDTAPTDETKRPGAMLDRKDAAYKTLKNLIGVNAEPYFYLMTATSTNTDNLIPEWTKQTVGFRANGTPIEVDYTDKDYDPTVYNQDVPQAVNYPVFDNCYVQNAMVGFPRTLFQGGMAKASLPAEEAPKINPKTGTPYNGYGYNAAWLNASNGGAEKIISGSGTSRVYMTDDVSYEYWAACRSGNVGAALREANNALLNPNTSRRFGTIWIVILMSDGGAGGSDPVRRNGRRLEEALPYAPNKEDPLDTSKITSYGQRGEYGAFGLCPIGIPSNPGELITYDNDLPSTNPAWPQAVLPNCADELPETRHTCDFRPLLTLPANQYWATYGSQKINPMQDVGYKKIGEPGGPPNPPPGQNADAWVLSWNKSQNNLYDVDIAETREFFGVANNLPRGGCDILYDVEDYARDWADYIAIANLGTSTGGNTQVPTVFTIGFAIEFTNRPANLLADPTKLVNDPANAATAQTNVQGLCRVNVDRCLGEQLLRYIADVGDNNRIDNDYYQDMMYEWYDLESGGMVPGSALVADGYVSAVGLPFGARDACQIQDEAFYTPPNNNTYDTDGNKALNATEFASEWGQLRANVSCGNYYYSPNADQLQFVFDDIASRMFTRLAR